MAKTILAIDPHPDKVAWVIYDIEQKRLLKFGIGSNSQMLFTIEYRKGSEILPDVMAIEMIASYGMAVGKTTFETCRWVGIFQHAFGLGKTRLIYRKDVKMHLCNSMRAKDSNIRQAIIDRYPATGGGKTPQIGTKKEPGPLYGVSKDIWSALAVAIFAAENEAVQQKDIHRLA